MKKLQIKTPRQEPTKERALVSVEEENASPNKIVPKKNDSSNIQVAVRLRPLTEKEIEEEQFEIVQVLDQKVGLFLHNLYRWLYSEIP